MGNVRLKTFQRSDIMRIVRVILAGGSTIASVTGIIVTCISADGCVALPMHAPSTHSIFTHTPGHFLQSAAAPSRRQQLSTADAAFRAGYAAAQSGDLATAEKQFRLAVRSAPSIAEGHSALGAVLVQLAKYRLAIPELERALALKPGDRTAELNLAVAYEQTGSAQKAVSLFEIVDHAEAHDQIQSRTGAQTQAQTQAETASAPLPASFLIPYARALVATHHSDRAMERLKAAVITAPDDAMLRDTLGTLEAQHTHWEEAGEQFHEAIRINPQLAEAHLHLGVTLLMQQKVSDAIPELTTATELAPGNAEALVELGKALNLSGDAEKAITALRKALVLLPSAPAQSVVLASPAMLDAKYQLALALQSSGHAEQAIPFFRDVLRSQPRNAPAATNLALALVQTGNSKEAIPLYQQALADTPDKSGAALIHQGLGAAYLQQSNLDEAIREFRAGLQIDPDGYELHYNLGLAWKLKDDTAAAAAELKLAAQLNPASPDPPYTLGILDMQLGRFDDAAENLKKALGLRPENFDGWATLGSVYKQLERLPEATDALEHAIRLQPDQPGPHITLAAVLAQQGQSAQAAAERRNAAALTRVAVNRQHAQFATGTGKALLQKGDTAAAIERFEEAISNDSTYAEAHQGLADALDRSGKPEQAKAEREKAALLKKAAP